MCARGPPPEPSGTGAGLGDARGRGARHPLLEATTWDPDERALRASGSGDEAGTDLVAFVPGDPDSLDVTAEGLTNARLTAAPQGGTLVLGQAAGPTWSFEVTAR